MVRVDSMCAVGNQAWLGLCCPLLSRLPTQIDVSRGLLCGQLLAGMFDPHAKAPVARHLTADLVDAMNDGGVVPTSEGLPDFHQLHLQQFAGEIHRDLARNRESFDSRFGPEPLRSDAAAPGNDLLDLVDRGTRER